MALQENLANLKAQFNAQVPQRSRDIMERATNDLKNSGILDRIIKPGDKLPPFTLPNQDGAPMNSTRLLEKGPLVVSVFRGAWCPYCVLELEALEATANDFRAAGAEVLIISPQMQEASRKLRAEKGLSFDLLSDLGNHYTSTLGLEFTLPEDLRKVYGGFGIDLPTFNGDDTWQLPMPARLIVDQTGVVTHADINPDYTQRPNPEETLAALKG